MIAKDYFSKVAIDGVSTFTLTSLLSLDFLKEIILTVIIMLGNYFLLPLISKLFHWINEKWQLHIDKKTIDEAAKKTEEAIKDKIKEGDLNGKDKK